MRRLVGEFVGSASGIANGIRIVVLRARTRRRTRIVVRILSATLFGAVLAVEVHTSWFQSKVLSAAARTPQLLSAAGFEPAHSIPSLRAL